MATQCRLAPVTTLFCLLLSRIKCRGVTGVRPSRRLQLKVQRFPILGVLLAVGMGPAALAQATFTHHWTFDDTLNDSIGTQPLTVNAGPTYTAGILGEALQVTHCSTPQFCFSPTVAHAGNVIAPGSDGSFSLSSWFKYLLPAPEGCIYGYGQYGAVGTDLAVYTDSANSRIVYDYFASNSYFPLSVNPHDGNWHNVIASYDGTNHVVYAYLDGKFLGTDNKTLVFHDATPYAIGVGGRDTNWTDSITAALDDVYFGTGVITQTQVNDIWNNGQAGSPSSGTIQVTTNSVNATFTISGPDGITLHGSGKSGAFYATTPGTYTITYGPYGSYVPPASQPLILKQGENISFYGAYGVFGLDGLALSCNGGKDSTPLPLHKWEDFVGKYNVRVVVLDAFGGRPVHPACATAIQANLANALDKGLKTAAYALLDFDHPDGTIDPTDNQKMWSGAWQIDQALAAVGKEQQKHLSFFSVDVEGTKCDLQNQLACMTRISEAVGQVTAKGLMPVIYTLSSNWFDITSGDKSFSARLLWDSYDDFLESLTLNVPEEKPSPPCASGPRPSPPVLWSGYWGWSQRIGKQYNKGCGKEEGIILDGVQVDFDIFDISLLGLP